MAKKPAERDPEIQIAQLTATSIVFHILYRTPFLFNSLSVKAQREFLLPAGRRRTAADRAASLKHDCVSEFRESVYTFADPTSPTLLGCPAASFKAALASAALDLPGAKKAEIGRLVWSGGKAGTLVPLWGLPRLHMAAVRSADMNHTPDMRTRAIVDEWCCEVPMSFVTPRLSSTAMANLMFAAGLLSGVGDGRQQKGKLSFGQFQMVVPNTEEWDDYLRIKETGGRAAQVTAMRDVIPYDDYAAGHMAWYLDELDRRGHQSQSDNDDDDDTTTEAAD